MTSLTPLVIIGAGGFGRETLDVAEAINAQTPTYDIRGFIVDAAYGQPGTIINGQPILGGFDWLAAHHDTVHAVCAVGDPAVRRRMVVKAQALGIRFASLVHPSVVMTRWVTIGVGAVVCAGVILTNQIRIGQHVQLNLLSAIGHDVTIEDFVTLLPGATISGNVLLQEGAYVGASAVTIEKRTIGAWSIVGAGAVVIRDVPANTTAVGNPANVIKTRDEGWHLQS